MSQIDAAIARAFSTYPDSKSLADAATAVARDRFNIIRMLQHRAESIADVEVKRLLVSIAEEIVDMPVQLEP